MKFERLKASIVNNAREEPSVYMAVCAIESLLRDLEDESGRPVDQLPAGDEMLSAKLIWLSRTLRGIYTSRSDDLQRSRSRLDRAMEELRHAEDTLGDLAQEEKRLAGLQTRQASLEQQLRQLRETHAACVSVQEQIDALQSELDALRALDPEKLQGELDRLRSQVSLLEGEQRELDSQLKSEQNALAGLRGDCDTVKQRLEAARREKEEAARALLSLQAELEQGEALLQQQKAQALELEGKKQELQQQREAASGQLQELDSALSAYRNGALDPLLRDLEEARIEQAKHEEEKTQILEKLQQHKQQRDRLVLDIASLKQECEGIEAVVRDKDEERIRAEARCRLARDREQELQQKLDSLREELSSLQDQVSRLEKEELPQQQQFTAEEQERRDKLLSRRDEAKVKSDQLREETERLTLELRELEEDCRLSQRSYDALSADSAGKREELQVLGARIQELEGKTEVQRYEVLKRQQEDRIRELEQLCDACRKLEALIPEAEQQLASEQQKFRELTAKRDQMAKTKQEIAARLEQLKKFDAAEYDLKLSGCLRRLALLNEGRERLRGTLDLIREVTGAETLGAEGQDLLRQTGQGVKQLQDAVLSLQKALLNCADLAQLKNDD